jgi:hypothetical protein
MVEVFKTNVNSNKYAGQLLGVLHMRFPQLRFNFDLEDRENILRVEAGNCQIEAEQIMETVREHSFQIEILPDLPAMENRPMEKF